ncbi:MAG: RidA family protein [Planctomycetaceae bacterium]|nr:MAG: RidA family protein [Planctomycetaceae bacterium]
MSAIEEKLKSLGFELPHAPPVAGYYLPAVQTGHLVLTSGQLPFIGKEIAFVGKLGANLHEEDGKNAARLCVVNALAQVKNLVGSLDCIRRVVRLEGYVHSAPGFQNQSQVLNAASELLVQLLGDSGRHVRVAVGVAEMPLNAALQLALWVEVA